MKSPSRQTKVATGVRSLLIVVALAVAALLSEPAVAKQAATYETLAAAVAAECGQEIRREQKLCDDRGSRGAPHEPTAGQIANPPKISGACGRAFALLSRETKCKLEL